MDRTERVLLAGFEIKGWGAYRPETILASSALDARHGHPPGWTEDAFGIRARGVAGPHETTSFMAAAAVRAALDRAGWPADSLGAVIGGCGVMEQPIPGTAALVQDRLGLGRSGVPAFDVNQTCLSFVLGLDVAALGLAAGRWRRVAVFASDIASCGLDPADAKVRSIFGDGAGAVVIEASDGGAGLLGLATETHGAHAGLAQLRAGGTRLRVEEGYEALVAGSRFEMDAFGIFKAAARCLPGVIERALDQAGVARGDLACVVCHQASAPGVEHVRRLFAPDTHVVDLFATHGNQIAASIPTVLAHALDEGRAGPGDAVLLLGTAAGISATAMVLRL